MIDGVVTESMAIAWLCFCRVGGCFIAVPGLSSIRLPMRIRLAAAVVGSLALWPLAALSLKSLVSGISLEGLAILIVAESLLGFSLGMICRIFFIALEFSATAVANFMGITNGLAPSIVQGEPSAPLADMIILCGVVLFFVTDQHLEVFVLLARSFAVRPNVDFNELEAIYQSLATLLGLASQLGLRLAGPFLVSAFFVNAVLGICNRMVPQIPVQFVGAPILLGGGLCLVYFAGPRLTEIFIGAFSDWLLSK